MNSDKLKLKEALKVFDNKMNVFSIKFIKANGELVFIPRCIPSGVNGDMKTNHLRGVQPINTLNQPIGHKTPIKIFRIIQINGKSICK